MDRFQEIVGLTREEVAEIIASIEEFLAHYAGYSVVVEQVHLEGENEDGSYEPEEDGEPVICADVTFADEKHHETWYDCSYSLREILEHKEYLESLKKSKAPG